MQNSTILFPEKYNLKLTERIYENESFKSNLLSTYLSDSQCQPWFNRGQNDNLELKLIFMHIYYELNTCSKDLRM